MKSANEGAQNVELKASIDYAAFAEAFNKFPIDAAKELRIQMKAGARAIVRDAQLHHRFKRKSGALDRSVKELISQDGLSGVVFLDEGVASYGKYVHEGTRPHIITAKKKKTLYFVSRGQKNFPKIVNHPGTSPDKFLYQAADRQEPAFLARINKAIKNVIERFK